MKIRCVINLKSDVTENISLCFSQSDVRRTEANLVESMLLFYGVEYVNIFCENHRLADVLVHALIAFSIMISVLCILFIVVNDSCNPIPPYLLDQQTLAKCPRHHSPISSTTPSLFDIRVKYKNNIIIGHLNLNSLRNKFEALVSIVSSAIDILVTSETKIDNSFPSNQFNINGFHKPFRLDRNKQGGGILVMSVMVYLQN